MAIVVASITVRARAEELVQDETKAPAPPLATFTPSEGFRVRSADGDYMLGIGLGLGIKYEPVWTDGDAQKNGNLAFVRPAMSGHFFKPWLGYAVATELAADVPFLLEANIDASPWDALGLCVGQADDPLLAPHVVPPGEHLLPGLRDRVRLL